MANEQNLVPFTSEQSPEEAKKNGAKGGKASGRARREKKSMQELAKIVLNMPFEPSEEELDDIERTCFTEFPEKKLTVGERSLLMVAKKAMKGDASALTFLRDTAGERPIEKIEVSGDVETAANRIRDMIAAKKKAQDGGE